MTWNTATEALDSVEKTHKQRKVEIERKSSSSARESKPNSGSISALLRGPGSVGSHVALVSLWTDCQ